jgi:hypothetical protein
MSLNPCSIAPVPQETARVARAAFPTGNRYMTMRDELGVIYPNDLFADLRSICYSRRASRLTHRCSKTGLESFPSPGSSAMRPLSWVLFW